MQCIGSYQTSAARPGKAGPEAVTAAPLIRDFESRTVFGAGLAVIVNFGGCNIGVS